MSENKTQKTAGLRKDRIFVLDTNVLIHDAHAMFSFKGVVIGIPFIVLEELDTFKKEAGEKGHNVRETIRQLDALRRKGHLGDGVPLEQETDGAILKVFINPQEISIPSLRSTTRDIHDIKDNIILQTVSDLVKAGNRVTLVTKDINVRIKADALGLDSEDYLKGAVLYDRFHKGWTRLAVPGQDVKEATTHNISSYFKDTKFWPNQFIILENDSNPQQYKLFRHIGTNGHFKEVEQITLLHIFSARNIQQLMALDLLMDDSVQFMTLLGPAGTGKTFLALLAGLYKVAYEHTFRKLLVTRPIIALGSDIGYLPGDIQEKLHYWMQPVHDNLEFIASQMLRGTEEYLGLARKKEKKSRHHRSRDYHHNNQGDVEEYDNRRTPSREDSHLVDKLQRQGIISLEAITYMRGRSIPNQFVFIDEVQNLTPHEVKTLVSRAGEGTKVILAGDPYQIDSPYLDFSSNGLTVTTEKFKEHSIFGSVFLETSERSELAKLAAEVL